MKDKNHALAMAACRHFNWLADGVREGRISGKALEQMVMDFDHNFSRPAIIHNVDYSGAMGLLNLADEFAKDRGLTKITKKGSKR